MNQEKNVWLKGAIDTLPLIVAAIPFAIIFGALAVSYGFSYLATLGMSIFVFAGSSQFIAMTLIAASTPILVIVVTVFVVNIRHMLYSISLIPNIKNLGKWQRVPFAFWMTDESFAALSRFKLTEPTDAQLQQYYWGSAIAMYVNWVLCTWLGILLGQQMPNMMEWGLDIAMVLAFIAIVIPSIKHKAHCVCALVALLSAALTYSWPYNTGLLFSSLLAIVCGVMMESAIELVEEQ